MKAKQRKARSRRNKRIYFGPEHEEAIIKYVKSTCINEKTDLYIKFIQPAFSELVDKIVFTYKFTNLPNSEFLREDCKIWLTTILDKYNPDRGSKAFSYFSVITKNWFIHKVKTNAKRYKREVRLEDAINLLDQEKAITEHKYEATREKEEFWSSLLEFVERLQNDTVLIKNENDKKVVLAIYQILRDPDEVEILNKKAIYLYLREITGLNTKQIANTLKKVREKYAKFIVNWNTGK